ncbi:FimV protein [Legionella santicrucis]|uniref:FimV protein n=1 Tax=Legionella santicrucis TaxID=45074 RepID=A0A0W0ZFE6_9GAMM|nr:FimV/HubP family polar landmark protein [Legionella santicrucis]KTD67646.1 FimV protein [Legionella santicrucis]
MKKNVLFSALFALTLPAYVHALGLGEMKVKSVLEQPFAAEVSLIDAHEISLSNVRVSLADPQSYQSLGVERPGAADSLFFEIKKNKQGKFVIVIYSTERMTEPYLQLIIDLTWSKGQIYKVYTVLLDPPGYKLASTTAQSGLTYQRRFSNYHPNTVVSSTKKIHNKKNETYGPTVAQENVWQIAQRYKTSDAILPQVVLAIVGANPDAFTDGNLNGLKVGVRLKIPSAQEFVKVPADLATVEVMAHDKAWNEKISINHVLSPPYMIGQTSNINLPIEYSQIPPVPKFSDSTLPVSNQTQPESTSVSLLPSLENQKQISYEQSKTLNAEISITTAAVDSLRESNALLTEQLSLLQTHNKKLQKQLDVRDKEIASLHKQIQMLIQERIAGQNSSGFFNGMLFNLGSLIILLLIATGAGSIAFYYFKHREEKKNNIPKPTHPVEADTSIESFMNTKEEPAIQDKMSELKSKPNIELTPELRFSDPLTEVEKLKSIDDSQESVPTVIEPPLKPEESEEQLDVTSDLDEDPLTKSSHENESISKEELAEENLLEFESGLYDTIAKEPINTNYSKEVDSENEQGLEFTLTSSDAEKTTQNDVDLSSLKNEKALDTLLALAKTYIGMEDSESALNSLDEVLKHGTQEQKEEAKRLLAEIKGKT